MSTYEPPVVIELGSIADFTRGDNFAFALDGFFQAHFLGNDAPTS
jgi:hypothetical protein